VISATYARNRAGNTIKAQTRREAKAEAAADHSDGDAALP